VTLDETRTLVTTLTNALDDLADERPPTSVGQTQRAVLIECRDRVDDVARMLDTLKAEADRMEAGE
jgi:hypothetical protein